MPILCVHAGLSDPLVELSLVPDELFPKCSHMQFKTGPQKQTINPIFSTEFLMLVTHYNMGVVLFQCIHVSILNILQANNFR